MAITTVNVLDGPNIQADGQHRGVLEFVFHTGETEVRNVRAPDEASWLALQTSMIPELEAFMANKEIESHAQSLENSIDPYFDDMGGWFQKKTDFQHTLWDDSFSKAIKYYLSLDYQFARLELIHIQETISRISNTDLKAALDISQTQATQIRTDIQVAVDTLVADAEYAPLFDADGVLI